MSKDERDQIIKSINDIKGQMDSLSALLTQEQERLEAVQSAEPWKPKEGEIFWFVTTRSDAGQDVWDNYKCDRGRFKAGNCFQTELEAKRHAAKMKFMFRRGPKIERGEEYWSLGYDIATIKVGNPINYVNDNQALLNARQSWGLVFKTREEAEEWRPLYKFAFLGGDCPEVSK